MTEPTRRDDMHLRIARPSRNLEAAVRFWVNGVGMEILWKGIADPFHLVMVGFRHAAWHLELTRNADQPVAPTPTDEDLIALYVDGEIDPAWIQRIGDAGGRVVPAANPYWDAWGVTFEDPDGYRLVLCRRNWVNDPV